VTALDRSRLVHELRALGVPRAATVMVHASLKKLGPVAGGADAVLDAIVETLGPEGTLVMNLGAPDDVAFDAALTPADPSVGVLAEVLRRRSGAQVNDHVAARFAALGPRASALLEPTPHDDYYGPGSPLARFAEDGLVLRLGADVDTITLTHYAEYLADIHGKRRVRRRYEHRRAGVQWVESLDDTDGIVAWSEGDYFSRIWLDYLATSAPWVGAVGGARAELFAAAPFVLFAARWIERTFGG